MMRSKKNRFGFTMAELLIVVAIIAVLGGVSAVAVQNYQRGMAQLERDAIAKEIFVAAQNHLNMADSQGFLGTVKFGMEDAGSAGTYYYVVNGKASFDADGDGVLNQMLPFASVDETVRTGGSYIIRYQKNPALVLDVFYTEPKAAGIKGRFTHTLSNDDYDTVVGLAGDDQKSARRDCAELEHTALGWYGGDGVNIPVGNPIQTPLIAVKNNERLTVEVTYANQTVEGVSLKLIIVGETSQAQAAFPLSFAGTMHARAKNGSADGSYTITLDDITVSNMHFADMNEDSAIERVGTFIPGENVTVQAVAYSNSVLTNIAYSSEITTNSLFADIDDALTTAMIGNMRHLENLDDHISGVKHDDEEINGKVLNITAAMQLVDLSKPAVAAEGADDADTPSEGTPLELGGLDLGGDGASDADENADLSWPGFLKAIGGTTVKVYGLNDTTGTKDNCFRPVTPSYALDYAGQGHSVEGVKADYAGNAGLFGELKTNSAVSDLKLIDFNITGTTGAGALAGVVEGTTVKNVIAYNTDGHRIDDVTATTGGAGGLIGTMNGGEVVQCAAALTVSGKDAGGLIGTITGTAATVKQSYSGGHTDRGEYYAHDADGKRGDAIYNVTGTADAGGLIGDAGSAKIQNCYSTCSVTGATAGGFVGEAEGDVSGSYATGLVHGTAAQGAFAGKLTGSAADCKIFEIVNDAADMKALGEGSKEGVAIGELDEDLESYKQFIGDSAAWNPAQPYDKTLVDEYTVDGAAGFSLKTVDQLAAASKARAEGDEIKANPAYTHYGDWPAPETLVVNEAE